MPDEHKPTSHSIHTFGGTVRFTGDITFQSINDLQVALVAAAQYRMQGLSSEPLRLEIYSLGGDTYAGFVGYETLRRFPIPVHAIVTGYVASAAVTVIMGARRRTMYPTASLLVHQLSHEVKGRLGDMHEELANMDHVHATSRKIYLERTKLPEATLDLLLRSEKMLSAQQALEYGFVHEIEG